MHSQLSVIRFDRDAARLLLAVTGRHRLFEILQIRCDFLNGLGAFGTVLSKQVLLSAAPNKDRLLVAAAAAWTGRWHHFSRHCDFDGIRVDAILDNLATRKDRLNAGCRSLVLLFATVSVAALLQSTVEETPKTR